MVNTSLISRIQKRLDDSAGRLYPANDVVDELELASSFISSHRTFQKHLFRTTGTFTLTNGTDTYDLATQLTNYGLKVHQVIYDPTSVTSRTSVKLQYVTPDKIFDYQYNNSASVDYYTLIGSQIIFAGVPSSTDANVTIKVWFTSTDGTYANDGTETTLGKYFPHLLVNKVCYELGLSQQDAEISATADRFNKAFEQGMEQALNTLGNETTEPRFISTDNEGII